MQKSKVDTKKKRNKAMLLIFLCWIVYMVSYFGKVNYSANITQIVDFYGVTKAQAGIAPTFFFFAYGTGQFINGAFSKKYKIKPMVFLSLIISALINLCIAVSTDFSIVKWLWLVNGLVLSVLWPMLIRVLAENLPSKSLRLSSVVMGTTVAGGTLIIYALSSLYAALGKFKLSFYTASFSVIAVAVLWLLMFDKAIAASKSEWEEESEKTDVKDDNVADKQIYSTGEKKIFFAVIGILCFFAIGVNLTKDGLTTWVPSILKEEFGMSDALSILLTLFLPILAIFGNAFAIKIHDKIPDYVNHCTTVFAVCACIIGFIIASLAFKLEVPMLVCLIAVNFLASSLNSLITGIFPLFMRDKLDPGTVAGMLNGFSYLGSTLSSYGLGVIADSFGWTSVFVTLMGFCFLTVGVWFVYIVYKRRLKS